MAEAFRKPYLDTSVYLAAIKAEPGRVEIAKRILADAHAGALEVVASTFVAAEVIRGRDGTPPLEASALDAIDRYLLHESITWVELDLTLAIDARRLARQHGLKPADAVHLASAIRGGADQLLRWDDKFRLKNEVYDGVIVCEPHLVGRPEPLPGIEAA